MNDIIRLGIDKYTSKGINDGYANEEYANEMRNDGFEIPERRDASPEFNEGMESLRKKRKL